MSLSGAMNTAVSALKSQSQALSVISNNLANSSTTGYKSVTTSFASLVTQMSNGNTYNGAGVTSSARQNVSAQGNIESTSNNTDLAIDGNGMFAVRYGADNNSVYFTRNGEFDQDKNGYLVNNNYYLMGWPTDENGKLTVTESSATLQKINVTNNVSSVKATTTAAIDADLGPTSATSSNYATSMEIYDALGNLHTVDMAWSKTGTNQWSLSFSSDDGTTTTAATALTFDGTGALTSPSPASVNLAFTWSNGASNSAIAVDLSSLTQTYGSAGVNQTSTDTDGHPAGKLLEVSVGSDGTVTASYDNGEAIPIYKVAVATFPNYDGLSALSDGIYQASSFSGDYTLHTAGEGGSGTIDGSCLESSTVDTADEFTRMIVAQQAYSAASQVITSAKDMFDSLISAVR
jgi:flagellar hook protein FlgE